jgi:hypothetical protein
MMERAPFVCAAVAKPAHTYFLSLLTVAPVHLYGLLFCVTIVPPAIYLSARRLRRKYAKDAPSQVSGCISISALEDRRYFWVNFLVENSVGIRLFILSSWPFTFLIGLTVLGSVGAGFQSRFLLPIFPATAVLTAAVATSLLQNPSSYQNIRRSTDDSMLQQSVGVSVAVFYLLSLVSGLTCIYYSTLFAPLFADIEYSIFDILRCIIVHPIDYSKSFDGWEVTKRTMQHFGLHI